MSILKKVVRLFFVIIVKTAMIIYLIYFMFSVWQCYIFGRGIYKFGEDQYITVWKRPGGCYIMPYKYLDLTSPDNNFILAHNLGFIHFYKEDSTLLIYDESMMEEREVKGIYLPDYKYEYIGYPYFDDLPGYIAVDSINAFYQRKKKRVKNLPAFFLSIREPYAVSRP